MTDKEWPTIPVELDHLETMGLLMAVQDHEDRDGLSQPQVDAKRKLEAAWQLHAANMGVFKRGPR